MRKQESPIRLIEASYAAFLTESAWLENVTDAATAYDLGQGVVALTVDLTDRPRVRNITARGEAASLIEPLQSFVEGLPRRTALAVFAPTEFVGNASWRIRRLAGTTEDPGLLAFRPPLWGMVGGDGCSTAIALAFQGPPADFAPEDAFPHEDRRVLGLVAAHFGSALRLRSALPNNDAAATEAVLDSSGRVLHASGDARAVAARTSLTEAVMRSEQARGRLRRTDAACAADLWRALVAGRWSLVESVERDGKRLLLARANRPSSPEVTALTKEESDVVWLAAFGHTYKFIAYELGVTVSSAVRRLKRAMTKLGVATRQDLLRKLGR